MSSRAFPIKLDQGDRIEGFFGTPSGQADINLTIKDPSGTIIKQFGQAASSTFMITAATPGYYLLVFTARSQGPSEFGIKSFGVTFSYEIYGR